MNSPALRLRNRSPAPTLALATLLVGSLDIAFATGFWALRGVPPIRILQAVAAGLLGPAAFAGGAATAAVGLLAHYCIAAGMVTAFFLASRRWQALTRQPVRYGVAYGLLLYVVMNFVVVPLSAAPAPAPNKPMDMAWVGLSIVAHVLLVGIPCALMLSRAQDKRTH